MARVTSSLLVSALCRRAEQKGGAAYIRKRGTSEAGALFIVSYDIQTRQNWLFEPAPQSIAAENNINRDTRSFVKSNEPIDDIALSEKFEKESKFDPDFWVIELEGLNDNDLEDIIQIIDVT